jgi:hypothetical protein
VRHRRPWVGGVGDPSGRLNHIVHGNTSAPGQ